MSPPRFRRHFLRYTFQPRSLGLTFCVKNMLVDCDESGREKLESDLQQRVSDLLNLLANQKQSARHQVAMSELTQKRLNPGDEDLALSAIFQDLKRKDETQRRQAGSSPTDG